MIILRKSNTMSKMHMIARTPYRNFSKAFKASDLLIKVSDEKRTLLPVKDLIFGKTITDHMFVAKWNQVKGWENPQIIKYDNYPISTTISGLNYAITIYDGMKVYKNESNQITIFRGLDHLKRFKKAAERMCLPEFDEMELFKCLKKLILLDQRWIPTDPNTSLYVRPLMYGTEETLRIKSPESASIIIMLTPVGGYFKTGANNAVSLLADPQWVRSWPGGSGSFKTGCNYGTSIYAQKYAESKGCNQVLWLHNEHVTEVGTMNFFVVKKSKSSKLKLCTPNADDLILNGITRQSIIEIAEKWKDVKVQEKPIKLEKILENNKKGKIVEIFGSGTACVVSSVGKILYKNEWHEFPCDREATKFSLRLREELSQYHTKVINKNWTHIIE